MKVSHIEIALFFAQIILLIFLSWKKEYIEFTSTIIWHTSFIQFMTFMYWFGNCFMHPRGISDFSKPAIVRIQLASLGIRIHNTMIFLDILLLCKFGCCTPIQCNLVLCTNFSLQFWVDLCTSSSNFCEFNCSKTGLRFHTFKIHNNFLFICKTGL